MVHKKKKKRAGQGCVPFHFQRDNVEVCFTGPEALTGEMQALGSTKTALWMEILHGPHSRGKEAQDNVFLIRKLFTRVIQGNLIVVNQTINIATEKLN